MQIDVSRFRAAFYVEAAEHLQHMEAALLRLDGSDQDRELLNTIFRGAHSIKGASTTFGVDEVGKFTHVLENLLEQLRDGAISTTSELTELLLTSVDVIDGLIANARDGAPMPDNIDQVLNELRQANGQASGHGATTEGTSATAATALKIQATYRIEFQPSREFFRFGQDPLLLLRELAQLGTILKISVDDKSLPGLEELQPEDCYLQWTLELETESTEQNLQDVFMFLDEASRFTILAIPAALPGESPVSTPIETQSESEIVAARESQGLHAEGSQKDTSNQAEISKGKNGIEKKAVTTLARASENETVRVDRIRLDELINQIGELVIGASMVEQEILSLAAGQPLESMSALGKIVRDLQEMSLGLRMVPIAATFQKMNRVIREVAKKVGKQVNFVTEGDDTELDKSVVDQISDPLVHMVRNAADHGIELPEERLAVGKPSEGTVKLRAFQQGGNVFIELSDDGRGLDRQRILAKAIERELISADATPTDAEICNMIFLPGFSTAKEVTDVSGRGVGMDVVRRNVEALQGSVTVRSTQGHGSIITVRLPLTLAILDGLLVRLSNQIFVIPLLSVIESICIRSHEVHRVANVGDVVMLRGEVVPLLRLHQLLNIKPMDDDQGLLVIVEEQGKRIALKVDELLGQQQVVIKNLETNYRKVPGVAGATILGDGQVALILDVFGIVSLSHEHPNRNDQPKLENV